MAAEEGICIHPRSCVWFVVIQLPLWLKMVGSEYRVALVPFTSRDVFHILLNHMQLHQSSRLTWHTASGSVLLIPGSEAWPPKTGGRRARRFGSREGASHEGPKFSALPSRDRAARSSAHFQMESAALPSAGLTPLPSGGEIS